MNKKLLSIEQDGFINRLLSFEITLAKNYTFGTFYLPFLAAAKQEYLQALSIHTRSENPDTLFCPGMSELILSRLHAVCVRTLIVETVSYTHLCILGFMAASMAQVFPGLPGGREWLTCLLMLAAGFLIIYFISEKEIRGSVQTASR